jgi:hypothetical protein
MLTSSRLAKLALVATCLLDAPSCASKEVVSLTASIGAVNVAVAKPGGLVTTVSGSFDVALELGQRASEGTDVSFTEFSLVRNDTGGPVLGLPYGKPLAWVSSQPLPLRVEPGARAQPRMSIGTRNGTQIDPMQVGKDDFQTLCSGVQLKIVGTLQDSANGGRTTPIASPPFVPSGC